DSIAIYSPNPASNLKFLDLTIRSWGYMGIDVAHASNVQVLRCTITDIVYAGVLYDSVNGGTIANNTISNCHGDPVGLGYTSCYGIAVSRESTDGELTTDPNSRNVTISGNTVSDVPSEGIDSHGGQNLTFSGNKVYRCDIGIAVLASTDYAGNYVYPPTNCLIVGN